MSGSIVRRIITGFGIVLVLALVASIIGVTALRNARESNSEVGNQVLYDDVLSREVDTHFLRADQNFLRALLESRGTRAG